MLCAFSAGVGLIAVLNGTVNLISVVAAKRNTTDWTNQDWAMTFCPCIPGTAVTTKTLIAFGLTIGLAATLTGNGEVKSSFSHVAFSLMQQLTEWEKQPGGVSVRISGRPPRPLFSTIVPENTPK